MNVFRYQAEHNPLYKRFLTLVKCAPTKISDINDIPLLPISCFKRHNIKSGSDWNAEHLFLSSGTMQDGMRSKHHIKSLKWYHQISSSIFKSKMTNHAEDDIIALLPSYLENGNSSLVEMVNYLQHTSQTSKPFTFLYNLDELHHRMSSSLEVGKSVLLIGVTFALLDYSESYQISNPNLSLLYTGGMKNRREDIEPEELRQKLKDAFPQSLIYSEYGMTELQSQAYTDSDGLFSMSPTLRVLIKEFQDPFKNKKHGKSGQVGIIDLANIDTLSFILSDDLGVKYDKDSFHILGRLSNADRRGCHLLYEGNNNFTSD